MYSSESFNNCTKSFSYYHESFPYSKELPLTAPLLADQLRTTLGALWISDCTDAEDQLGGSCCCQGKQWWKFVRVHRKLSDSGSILEVEILWVVWANEKREKDGILTFPLCPKEGWRRHLQRLDRLQVESVWSSISLLNFGHFESTCLWDIQAEMSAEQFAELKCTC